MAYRYGNRNQINLFPESMEDYIAPDDPVRAYDAFVGALDFRDLGITLDANKVGIFNNILIPQCTVFHDSFLGFKINIYNSKSL